MTQFYEFYTHPANILLFTILTTFIIFIYAIGFVRFNVAWAEWDYSETVIFSIVLLSFITTPIINHFIKITSHSGIKQLFFSLNNNFLFTILTYGTVTAIILSLSIFGINIKWWNIQAHPETKKAGSTMIALFSTISLVTTFAFTNANISNNHTIITLSILLLSIIIINFIAYMRTKNEVKIHLKYEASSQ